MNIRHFIQEDKIMIAQWDTSLSVLLVVWVQFPTTAEYFKGYFPG